jgi:hypothetical protein
MVCFNRIRFPSNQKFDRYTNGTDRKNIIARFMSFRRIICFLVLAGVPERKTVRGHPSLKVLHPHEASGVPPFMIHVASTCGEGAIDRYRGHYFLEAIYRPAHKRAPGQSDA